MNKPKLVGDLVSHWTKYGENRPTIVFATSIKHSKYICNIFNHNGIPAGHIDGEMPEIEREQVLQKLDNDEIKVLSNCMVLTEGWDQPKVSCVIIARPTKSYSMYLQMIGRTLRPYPNKEDTLIIDHSGCVYEHGFPEDVPQWTLKSTSKKEKEKITKEKVEKQPLTCTQCHAVYKPVRDDASCPQCSHVPTKKERQVLIQEGRLVEMPKMKPNSKDKENFYAQLVFYAKQKGYKEGWASWTFKRKYGHFPHSKKVFPVSTGKDVIKFIQHCNIRMAKSKNVRELAI
jgi:superfamily II DNA or RNA helicase